MPLTSAAVKFILISFNVVTSSNTLTG
ncbi:unnamed protein product, partial [Rotaria magnacalcarata]